MHVLLLGGNGQLGRAIQNACSPHHDLTVWGHAEADISAAPIVDQIKAVRPDVVINCAAWTNVDGAEKEAELAFAANMLGPLHIAVACAACNATMVHVSTNEVFAGTPGRFYFEYDQPAPGSVYARSKLAGEAAASRMLDRIFIVRVAWLFGAGGSNFPSKIVAAADRNGALKVVNDEFGNPTYAPDVADAIFRLVESRVYGIYHFVNEGFASRYELAKAVLQAAGRSHIALEPIQLSAWPRPAPPPPHAVLVNQVGAAQGVVLRPWQEAVDEYAETFMEKNVR